MFRQSCVAFTQRSYIVNIQVLQRSYLPACEDGTDSVPTRWQTSLVNGKIYELKSETYRSVDLCVEYVHDWLRPLHPNKQMFECKSEIINYPLKMATKDG
jgi:hypothetical protein